MVQTFVGKVTSNKMMKSVVVTVTYLRKLPKYHVWRRFQSKIMAHDALNECSIGDTVEIRSCRPLSKRKAFEVIGLISRADQYDAEAQTKAKEQSNLAAQRATDRRIAVQNDLTSRRHIMDQHAIAAAEKEIAQYQKHIDRLNTVRTAVEEHKYAESKLKEESLTAAAARDVTDATDATDVTDATKET